MAQKEEFEIIITPDGQIKIEAIGFTGTDCVQPLKKISQIVAPGLSPIRQEKLPEYFQQSKQKGKITGETKE